MDLNSYKYQRIHDLKLAEGICVAAVVKVLKFDPAKMTVNVQPLSKHLENGKYESQPPILQVPVAVTHSGGFIFRPWFKPGDTGFVVYLDHDMDATVTGAKEAVPLTERNHATTDAIFVGALVAGDYKVKGLPEESIAIAKDDGEIFAAITKDKVILKNTDTTVVELTASSIDVKSVDLNITLEGDMKVTTGGKVYLN